nr:TrmB family transcriptional regulator sugar-binding domain-containing protein [Halomicrobium urmianum]
MMDDATLVERLERLGFSEKAVETYLSILERGSGTAAEVADATGVSKRYVYSISERLEERGFVDVADHAVPTEIRARPPEEAIDALTGDLSAIESALDDRFARVDPDVREFDVVKSRPTMLDRISAFVARAETEITLSIPHAHLEELAPDLRAAVDRGVVSRVLVVDAPTDESPDVDGIATVARAWEYPTPLLLTVDATYGVVAPVEMVTRTKSDQEAIAFGQEQIVPVLVGSFMGNYWPMGAETYVADPRPLPAVYDNFRHAVLDATLRLREGESLAVEATARPVDGDEWDTLSGTVVDTRQGLVEPATNDFPVEHSLLVDRGDEVVSVGGNAAFLENYETRRVALDRSDAD